MFENTHTEKTHLSLGCLSGQYKIHRIYMMQPKSIAYTNTHIRYFYTIGIFSSVADTFIVALIKTTSKIFGKLI